MLAEPAEVEPEPLDDEPDVVPPAVDEAGWLPDPEPGDKLVLEVDAGDGVGLELPLVVVEDGLDGVLLLLLSPPPLPLPNVEEGPLEPDPDDGVALVALEPGVIDEPDVAGRDDEPEPDEVDAGVPAAGLEEAADPVEPGLPVVLEEPEEDVRPEELVGLDAGDAEAPEPVDTPAAAVDDAAPDEPEPAAIPAEVGNGEAAGLSCVPAVPDGLEIGRAHV